VAWGVSATAGVTYVLEEATSPTFTSGLRVAYVGAAPLARVTDRAQGTTYSYRVRAVRAGLRDSARKTGGNGCAVPGDSQVGMPASVTVPASDPDGSYTISWGATATSEDGVSYVVEEATNPTFTAGSKVVYVGTDLGRTLSGRARNMTYSYRVKAIKAGWRDSGYRLGSRGCAVPGRTRVSTPASITVPSGDADGSYAVSWGGTATPGARYVLEEATSPDFSTGWRIAYYGTSLKKAIVGRVQGSTFYYRVKAVKPGLRDSGFRSGVKGCRVTSLELEPYAYRAYLRLGGPLETVFTMDKPKGWEVDISGMCPTLAFLIRDPAEPLRQIFYFGQIYPVYVDPAAKSQELFMCSLTPPPCPLTWVDAPVVNPLTVENFFSHWPQIAGMQNATAFMANFPPLDGIDIISAIPRQPMMGTGETALVRGVLSDGAPLSPKAGQGQFLASVVADNFGGKGGGFIVFGATAPVTEFKASVGGMVESLNSFTMTSVYYDWCVVQQQQTWGAVAQVGQTLREASDIIWEGWQSRTAAQDIMAYQYDDTLRQVEKVWDPITGNVYEFPGGFYDQYSLDPSAYNVSTLEPLPDGRIDLWEGTILNGPSHVY
jgi:hypothetical protein